jgi:hypothetical protein
VPSGMVSSAACWRTHLDYKIRWRTDQRPLVHAEKGPGRARRRPLTTTTKLVCTFNSGRSLKLHEEDAGCLGVRPVDHHATHFKSGLE